MAVEGMRCRGDEMYLDGGYVLEVELTGLPKE